MGKSINTTSKILFSIGVIGTAVGLYYTYQAYKSPNKYPYQGTQEEKDKYVSKTDYEKKIILFLGGGLSSIVISNIMKS